MKRFIIALTCVLVMVCGFSVPGFAATNPDVTVNGTFVNWTDARPYIDGNNRTMVPFRASMEACGLTVSWDGQKREASVTDGYTIVKVPIDKRVITINGKNKNIDTNAVIKGGRTYLPIRAVAEAFGYTVGWSDKDKLVSLIKLDKVYGFDMYSEGIWIGRAGFGRDGVMDLYFFGDENFEDISPSCMFKYGGETMIKYNDLIAVIDGYNTRLILGGEMIVYLR